jgi:hypothetical protein
MLLFKDIKTRENDRGVLKCVMAKILFGEIVV